MIIWKQRLRLRITFLIRPAQVGLLQELENTSENSNQSITQTNTEVDSNLHSDKSSRTSVVSTFPLEISSSLPRSPSKEHRWSRRRCNLVCPRHSHSGSASFSYRRCPLGPKFIRPNNSWRKWKLTKPRLSLLRPTSNLRSWNTERLCVQTANGLPFQSLAMEHSTASTRTNLPRWSTWPNIAQILVGPN